MFCGSQTFTVAARSFQAWRFAAALDVPSRVASRVCARCCNMVITCAGKNSGALTAFGAGTSTVMRARNT